MSSPTSPLETPTDLSDKNSSAKDRKRRRIYRACDYCRLRKSRCDGKMPCAGCKAIDHECSYSDSLRSRRGGPRYIEELEGKIRSLEHALHTVNEKERIENPMVKALLLEQLKEAGGPWNSKQSDSQSIRSSENSPPKGVDESNQDQEELLETMIEATGLLNIDIVATENEYRSQFLPASFASGHHDNFSRSSPLPPESPQLGFSSNFPQASPEGPYMAPLPPKKTTVFFIEVALNHPCCLMSFVHRPTLNDMLEDFYENNDMGIPNQGAMALLYGFSAVGALFSGNRMGVDADESSPAGSQYFQACQALVDPLSCNDIPSLQALICMVLFMQGTGMITRSYATICAATSVAVRLGLHRSSNSVNLDPLQQEINKRVFWVLRTMDTYICAMLGFPRTLADENVDQDLPTAVDDRFITSSGVLMEGSSSNMSCVNAHTRLIAIMAKALRTVYPSKRPPSELSYSYGVAAAHVSQVEAELETWFEELSRSDNSAAPANSFEIRAQLLLRMAYGHVQMVLYRPFLHHILRPRGDGNIQLRSYACASACIKAAMQIVWLAEELDSRGLIHEAYWFTSYIASFAVTTLHLFITTAKDDPTREETIHTAERGRAIVQKLAKTNPMAEWCLASLETTSFIQGSEFYITPS